MPDWSPVRSFGGYAAWADPRHVARKPCFASASAGAHLIINSADPRRILLHFGQSLVCRTVLGKGRAQDENLERNDDSKHPPAPRFPVWEPRRADGQPVGFPSCDMGLGRVVSNDRPEELRPCAFAR